MVTTEQQKRAWEVTVTSSDVAFIESVSDIPPSLRIEVGRPRRILGATDTVAQILGIIRDLDLNVLGSLIAAWLWQKARVEPSPSDPPAPSELSPLNVTPPVQKPVLIKASIRIQNLQRSITVDVKIQSSSAQEIESTIEKALHDAGFRR